MAQSFSFKISVEQSGRGRTSDIDSVLSKDFTIQELLDWTKAALIITSDEVLRDEQAAGFDKEPIMLVDGKRGKDIRLVSPLGQVEFNSRLDFGMILLDAYQGLLNRSKVLTGKYKASHYVFYNGNQVATDLPSLQGWLGLLGQGPDFKNGDVIRIVDIQPYARKLERLGVTAQRSNPRKVVKVLARSRGVNVGLDVVAPNGAYQLTARSIIAKYKQNAIIKFSFLPGTLFGLTGTFKGGRKGRNSAGRPYLYPSITFTIQERGLV